MKFTLPCPVLPLAARAEAARRLGITEAEVADIAGGVRAWRDGIAHDYDGYRATYPLEFERPYPGEGFHAHTGAAQLPADLLVQELDVPRDPTHRLDPPISARDVLAADALRIARHLAWRQSQSGPDLLAIELRALLQTISDGLAQETTGAELHPGQLLRPVAELLGLKPGRGAAGEPRPSGFDMLDHLDPAIPIDCWFVSDGYLVQFPYLNVVLTGRGEVRDSFPTRNLRAVGGDGRYLLLVPGGSAASRKYFSPIAYVRDLDEHRWLTGPVPASLPTRVAGTLPAAIVPLGAVVDLVADTYHIITPYSPNPASGHNSSACGHYAWDGGSFVLDMTTLEAVLDARQLEALVLVDFARTTDGWRFLVHQEPDEDDDRHYPAESSCPLRLLTGAGAVVREIPEDGPDLRHPLALSPDGTRLLRATATELTVHDADTGRLLATVADLAALAPLAIKAADGERVGNDG